MKMNKRIIALFMILPFVFIFLMFAGGSAASLYVDIPVTGISITNDLKSKTALFDLSTYQKDFFLKVVIYPTQAKNKKFTTRVESVVAEDANDENIDELAQIEIGDNGLVLPKSTGKAKIIVSSNSGNYEDSIIVNVVTSKPLSLDLSLENFFREDVALEPSVDTDYDYTAIIKTGRYYFSAECSPKLNDSNVTFKSSDTTKAVINSFAGFAEVLSSGSVIISAEVDGAYGPIKKSVLLNAVQADTSSGITVNGVDEKTLVVEKSKTSISCIVEAEKGLSGSPSLAGTGAFYIDEYEFKPIEDSTVETNKYILNLNFSASMPLDLQLEILINHSVYYLTIEFADFTFELYELPNYQVYQDSYVQHIGTTINYFILSTPELSDVEFEWSCDKPSLVELTSENGKCSIKAVSAGKVTITVAAYQNNKLLDNYVEFTLLFINKVTSAEFQVNTLQWGMTKNPVFCDKVLASNSYVDNTNLFEINVFENITQVVPDLSNFEFSSSKPNIAAIKIVNNKPYLEILSSGFVNISVAWKYSNLKVGLVRSSASIECVKDGVKVSTYKELVKATEDRKKIVLAANIMLGEKDASVAQLEAMTKTIETTYNWKYYENTNQPKPSVRYCIEFKNNVYGNGFSINGEYIAKAEDSTDMPLLFKGPLNFAEVPGLASAKAQDNIVFLVRTDNIIIDNVTLMGCSDDSIMTESGLNLLKLHRVGTVLEIMSDATVLNSRIKNGRNNVRTYGGNKFTQNAVVTNVNDVNADRERIVVKLESCIITQAREFLLKMGANNVLLGSKLNNSPNLQLNSSDVLITDDEVRESDEFYNKLVLTDITLKNCVLATSALFAIGIDSNYAGPLLSNDLQGELEGLNDMFVGWDNLGGTSFASVLRFEGDVRIYDWKELAKINSQTFVETVGAATGLLDINLVEIIKKAFTVLGEGYQDIIYTEDTTEYINTAIMMFGGGKNYSQVIFDEYENEAFHPYSINVDILTREVSEDDDPNIVRQGQIIPLVIGKQDFKFFMYNSKSVNSYQQQNIDFEDGTAYSWLKVAAR